MFKTELMGTVQYVTDGVGTRKAVLLDLDIWQKVIQILPNSLWSDIETKESNSVDTSQEDDFELQRQISEIRNAPNDPRFMADLQETMSDFSHVDSEWWERDA